MSGLEHRRDPKFARDTYETLDDLEELLNGLPDHPKNSECISLFLHLRRTVTLVLEHGLDPAGDATDEPD